MDPLTTAPHPPPPHQRTHPQPPTALHELVVEMASTPVEDVGTPDHLTWVCAQGRRALGVHGLAVHLVDDAGAATLVASSDPLTAAMAAGAATDAMPSVELADRAGRVVGRLGVHVAGPMPDSTRTLADVLAAGLVAAAAQRGSVALVARLTASLADRAPVEQAKGVLAERYQCDVGSAFAMIRADARRRRISVLAAAREVVATRDTVPG